VHAWGATVALAGTGRPPFGTGPAQAVLYRIVHDEPDLDGLPTAVAPLVAAAMDPDPSRRPSADELVQALGGWSTAEPVTVRLPRDLRITGATDVLDLERMQTQVIARSAATALVPHPVTQRLERVGAPAPPTRRLPLDPPPYDADDLDRGWPGDAEPGDLDPEPPPRRSPFRSFQVAASAVAALASSGRPR
jgi:hypothetical protein